MPSKRRTRRVGFSGIAYAGPVVLASGQQPRGKPGVFNKRYAAQEQSRFGQYHRKPDNAPGDGSAENGARADARALGEVDQTRTWNLLIDVVAQTGHFKPAATSLQNDFIVEGEEHYWVHVAIDRFTGQVLERQFEAVKE